MANDHIIELAKQIIFDPSIVRLSHMQFAELIVRDCIMQVESGCSGAELAHDRW